MNTISPWPPGPGWGDPAGDGRTSPCDGSNGPNLLTGAASSLTSDTVFGADGAVAQLATMTGSVGAGLTAALPVPVA